MFLFQGIKDFIRNNENPKIRLILGCIPNKEFEIANDNERRRLYEENFIDNLLNEDEFPDKKDKKAIIRLFAWLLDKGILEIKLGFIINDKGELASKKEINIALNHGMLHDKKGIFIDKEGNKIGFSGSLNETDMALLRHGEGITVHKSWDIYPHETENLYLKAIINEFDKYWNNKGKRIQVFSLPNDLLTKIKKYAPQKLIEEDYQVINDFYRKIEPDFKISIKINNDFHPFAKINWKDPPQIKSYQNWLINDRRGILSIATGVGKTLIAIRAIYEFLKEEKNKAEKKSRIIAIAVHSKPMIFQWRDEINQWLTNPTNGEKIGLIIEIYGDSNKPNIKTQIADIKAISLQSNKPIILICHYTTFARDLIPILIKEQKRRKILFIADEVHEMGTDLRAEYFSIFNPIYRLGLSATPERYFDTSGTKFLVEYFSGIIYEYEIKDAIKDGYLCPYEYYPIICSLNTEEITNYNRYTTAIAMAEAEKDRDENKIKRLKRARKKIIKKAESKIPRTIELVKSLKNKLNMDGLKYLLIYLEDKEDLNLLKNNLINEDFQIDFIIEDTPSEKRNEIIKNFKQGMIPILLAITILDQGINIPELKYGIITSSSGNKKQFIQRRGRLLRIDKKSGKRNAHIYDLIIPILEKRGNKIRVIESEIERAKIFISDCKNPLTSIKIFQDLGLKSHFE